jgi:hypothetical protein
MWHLLADLKHESVDVVLLLLFFNTWVYKVVFPMPSDVNPKMAVASATDGKSSLYGKTSHVWEVFECMGSLAIYGKTSHIREDFPSEGNLHIHSKTAHVWEDLPYMVSTRVCQNPFEILEIGVASYSGLV